MIYLAFELMAESFACQQATTPWRRIGRYSPVAVGTSMLLLATISSCAPERCSRARAMIKENNAV
jgi:hypothetical protein